MESKRLCSLLVLLFASAAVACGGDDDDDDSAGTPATCLSVCAQQNQLCGDSNDCGAICSTISDVAEKSGCTQELQEGFACLAEANKCDANSTICPSDDLIGCLESYCEAHPSEEFCPD